MPISWILMIVYALGVVVWLVVLGALLESRKIARGSSYQAELAGWSLFWPVWLLATTLHFTAVGTIGLGSKLYHLFSKKESKNAN